jgi:multiple antibiotic resistance protein
VEVYRQLARKIALATIVFLVVIEFLGSLLLSFFGISLPVVQVTGGMIIVATAWSLLFENDASVNTRKKNEEIAGSGSSDDGDLAGKIFYPFTFPITAGPGTLVVMLTLSARLSNKGLAETAAGHAGIVLAGIVLCACVYFCYGYAPRLIKAVSPSTVHGILRVIAFILMCIGVQIAWNGVSMLGASLTNHK